ncbi:unnamed protein product [Cuscuta europaea]|uniref:Uncharacterized protein n=1 Tax=Cuscuta europaea TaxID=41803 RepID=A0A9P1EJ03_CUSEU|nr:unnamed protein product [Cuscuta europaea]
MKKSDKISMKIQKKKKSKNVEFYRVKAFRARSDRSTGAVTACKSLLEASGQNSVATRFYTYSSMRPEGSTDWNSVNSAINVALKLLGKQPMTPPRGPLSNLRLTINPTADGEVRALVPAPPSPIRRRPVHSRSFHHCASRRRNSTTTKEMTLQAKLSWVPHRQKP